MTHKLIVYSSTPTARWYKRSFLVRGLLLYVGDQNNGILTHTQSGKRRQSRGSRKEDSAREEKGKRILVRVTFTVLLDPCVVCGLPYGDPVLLLRRLRGILSVVRVVFVPCLQRQSFTHYGRTFMSEERFYFH